MSIVIRKFRNKNLRYPRVFYQATFSCEHCHKSTIRRLSSVLRSKHWYCSKSCDTAARDKCDPRFLSFLLTGLSNKEISYRLNISEMRMKYLCIRFYKKYGVKDRIQLMAKLMTPVRDVPMREYAA